MRVTEQWRITCTRQALLPKHSPTLCIHGSGDALIAIIRLIRPR